ncbi:hypothetical protein [Natroniella sp. ANB-PHB2]|uniref:hypothetical protein n=1 Tax=Natroniella sp. ANB-PHB2 TaxID=3384444 RepID=UPI0038D3B401
MNSDNLIKVMLIASILMVIALFMDAAYLFAVSFPFLVIAWMAAGALKNEKIGNGYKWSLVSVLAIWLVGFLAMLSIDTTATPDVYIGGFPLATAIMVYFVWGLPFFTGTYAFGHFFETDCISKEELEEFEEYVKNQTDLGSSSEVAEEGTTTTA